MNIQSSLQFGLLTQTQKDKIAVAKAQSASGNFGIDEHADLLRGVLRDIVHERSYTGIPEMDPADATKLVEALQTRISNEWRGRLSKTEAMLCRDELDEVTSRLDEADYLVSDSVVDQIVQSYYDVRIEPDDERQY